MLQRRKSILDRFLLGYSFDLDREAFSLVLINYFLIVLMGIVVLVLHTFEKELYPITYRYHAIIFLSILNLFLIRKGMVNTARIFILVSLPFMVLFLPPLGGVFSDEFFFWFPYVPIGLSIVAHFILHPFRHRLLLFITVMTYFFITIFIDSYLIILSDGSEQIIPIVIENRFYYKLIPAFIFLFVNLALRLLFVKNMQFKMVMDSQYEELLQSEKMASMGILTSGLAHEINNPLNFISGSLNALNSLKNKYLNPRNEDSGGQLRLRKLVDQLMASAFEGVERASDIISKLDHFANPKVNNEKAEVNFLALMRSVLISIDSRLPYYINLTTKIQEDLKVLCHESQLKLVITYILRNAIDALDSKEKGTRESIEISATSVSLDRKPYTRISISNSGPKIPEKDLKHIFDPFFTSREAGEGVGLGLSLSYMIIKEQGGKLEVNNLEDTVRFDIFLPAWKEDIFN